MLGAVLVLIVGLALASVSGSRFFHERADFEVAFAKAFEVQVLAQHIATRSREALAGRAEAFDELKADRDTVEQAIRDLNEGNINAGFPSFRGNQGLDEPLKNLAGRWVPIRKSVDALLSRKDLILSMNQSVTDFVAHSVPLVLRLDEFITQLRQRDAPGNQIYQASRQLILIEQMRRWVSEFQRGNDQAPDFAESPGRNILLFSHVLDGYRNGAPDINLRALTDPEARALLDELVPMYQKVCADLEKIRNMMEELREALVAPDDIALDSQGLLGAGREAATALSRLRWTARFPSLAWFAASMAAVAFSLGVLLAGRSGSSVLDRGGAR
jgi:twitching motility protein PilJ